MYKKLHNNPSHTYVKPKFNKNYDSFEKSTINLNTNSVVQFLGKNSTDSNAANTKRMLYTEDVDCGFVPIKTYAIPQGLGRERAIFDMLSYENPEKKYYFEGEDGK